MSLTAIAWTFVFPAALSLVLVRRHPVPLALLAVGYILAFVAGRIGPLAAVTIGLLLAAAYAVAPERPRPWRIAGHVLFVVIAVGLGFHVLPGFDNPRVIGPVRYTAGAVPFTMHLNLDKPLAGFWLLLFWPALCLHRGGWSWARGALIGLVTAVVSLGLAVVFGLVSYAPKWPTLTWLWVLNNLLIVCVTEEAAFRGYLQEGLVRRFEDPQYGHWLAIAIAAALFGLAHAAGGVGYVLLAAIAGVGYGIAYRRGGLHAAVMAHFSLDLAHFLLFTYPRLAARRRAHAAGNPSYVLESPPLCAYGSRMLRR